MEYVNFLQTLPDYEMHIPQFTAGIPNYFKIDYNLMPGYVRSDYLDDLLENIQLHINKSKTPKQSEQYTYVSDTKLPTSQSIKLSSYINTDKLLLAVNNHLGEKYSMARRYQNGYSDCTSFVEKVYKDMGISIKGLAANGAPEKLFNKVDLKDVLPGDVVFLTYTLHHGSKNLGGQVRKAGINHTHAAIVLEVNGTLIKVAENSGAGKSQINTWEIGDPNKKLRGVINYAKGNRGSNELLCFGRLRT